MKDIINKPTPTKLDILLADICRLKQQLVNNILFFCSIEEKISELKKEEIKNA